MQKVFKAKNLWKLNRDFWVMYVPRAWERTPLDGKLAWIMIITYTLSVLTLIEMLAFR